MNSIKMFVTDLDGTLYRSDRTFSETDLHALKQLGDRGIIRVLATGRSLYAFNRAVSGPFPIDYLIFSTGLGIAHYPDPKNRIIRSGSMTGDETAHVVSFLESISVDYMIQSPVPESHVFSYRYHGNGNPDFLTRLNVYKNHCHPIETIPRTFDPSSQFVVIVPGPGALDVLVETQETLKEFSVIKTTSPFDGKTLWIEIFPKNVSKGNAVRWLANELNVERKNIAAIGNDYNDEDLLDYAEKSFVVENGPDDLKCRYTVVSSNDHDGVSEAVRLSFPS